MTSPDPGFAEAEKAARAFQIALSRIGASTVDSALTLWRRVPATKAAEVADDWLDDAVRLVMSNRRQSRDLALAYYRLVRALRTGSTIPDPNDPLPTEVTMADLREEFAKLIEETTGQKPGKESSGNADVIPIERISGINKSGDKEEARLEAEAEKEARIVLEALGTKNLQRQVEEIDPDEPARDVDEKRDKAHKKAGSRQAAAAARVAKNGGRGALWSLADRDKRVIGYVRASRTGTPCGWCAMLISRGLILYRSEQSATYGKDGDKYHDNCNCYAEPVYSEKDYKKSDRFDLNRKYEKLWPKVTRGLSGKAAVSAWRRFIRQQQKARPGGVAPDTDNAQEAV